MIEFIVMASTPESFSRSMSLGQKIPRKWEGEGDYTARWNTPTNSNQRKLYGALFHGTMLNVCRIRKLFTRKYRKVL
jgi:hypothetical protein